MATNAEIFANTYASLQKQRGELAEELAGIGKELAAAHQSNDPDLLKQHVINQLEGEQREVQGYLKETDKQLGLFKEMLDQAKLLENSEKLRPEPTLEERLQVEQAAKERLDDNRQESQAMAVAKEVTAPTPMGEDMTLEQDTASTLLLAAAVVVIQTAEKVADLIELAKGTLELSERRVERKLAEEPPQSKEAQDWQAVVDASEKELKDRELQRKEASQEQKALEEQLDKLQDKFDQRHANTEPERKAELQAQLDAQFEALREALERKQQEEKERLLEEQRREREDPVR